MSKKHNTKKLNLASNKNTMVIESPDQLIAVEDKIIDEVMGKTIEIMSAELEKLGFTKKQLVKAINESRDLLTLLAEGKITEDEAQNQITRNIIVRLIGHERLLNDEEVSAILRAINDDMDVQSFVENMGITKKDLKATIEKFVEVNFKDMGIIPEKVTNGLYKLVRDNWGSSTIDEMIARELLLQGTESFKALEDLNISKFFEASKGVTLEAILSFKEAAVESVKEYEEEKELQEIRATLRRTNPDLADRLVFRDKVEISTAVDGVKVIDINRKKSDVQNQFEEMGSRLKNLNGSMINNIVSQAVGKQRPVNL